MLQQTQLAKMQKNPHKILVLNVRILYICTRLLFNLSAFVLVASYQLLLEQRLRQLKENLFRFQMITYQAFGVPLNIPTARFIPDLIFLNKR